jgi:hypothetical protein
MGIESENVPIVKIKALLSPYKFFEIGSFSGVPILVHETWHDDETSQLVSEKERPIHFSDYLRMH